MEEGKWKATARFVGFFYVSVLQAGEKTVAAHGGEQLRGLEAFTPRQGSENAENEKEAPSRSNQDGSSVLFTKKAYFLFGTRRTGLEMGSTELEFLLAV